MSMNILLLQAGAGVDTTASAAPTGATHSTFELLLESGPAGIIISSLIILMSIIALFIFYERYRMIKRASRVDENFMNNIRVNVQNGNISAAKALCQASNSPVAMMVLKGIMRIGKPVRDIEHAIENVGKIEISKMESNLNILSIIAGVAPMFGFLGTIAGMIQTFSALAESNNLTIGVISGGIYVKMFTSALGLITGIMAFIFYNILNGMIDRVVYNMELSTFDFIDMIQEPSY
jgi:biopolymer transport protein ExbB